MTFEIRGDDAWTHLKFEGGPTPRATGAGHREPGSGPHVSATVMVLAEADEIDVPIDPGDLHVDVYRSTGRRRPARQQHRLRGANHAPPTGVVVTMQDERSQLQNRERGHEGAAARACSRLRRHEQAAAASAERKAQVGGGGRSEKIRTYNYKENRVTDHRIGLTVYKLQAVLSGDLDEVVEPARSPKSEPVSLPTADDGDDTSPATIA